MGSNIRRVTRQPVLVLLIAVACSVLLAAPTSLTSEAILEHIKFLASDDLKGRGDGSPELEIAADYVAKQFKAAGLQPGGTNNEWFQPFQLEAGLTVGKDNTLSLNVKGKKVSFSLGSSYYPLSAPANEDPSKASAELRGLPLVFAGYGIAVPNVGYDDYARVDVTGKAVLIFSHEPQERDPNSKLNGARPVPQTSLASKASLARSHGAKMLLVIGDPSHRADDAP
jgi:hypothetical protein